MVSYLYILIGIPLMVILYFVITYLISLWIPPVPGDSVSNNVYQIAKNEPLSLTQKNCFSSTFTLPPQTFGVSFFLYLNQTNPPNANFTGMNSILSIGKQCSTGGNQDMSGSFLNVSIANNSSSLMVKLTPESQSSEEILEFEIDDTIPLRKPVHYFLQCNPTSSPRGNILMLNVFRNGEFIRSKTIYRPLISTGSGGIQIQTGRAISSVSGSLSDTYSASLQRLYIFERASDLKLKDIQKLANDPVSFS
jgi:hypothetical protein